MKAMYSGSRSCETLAPGPKMRTPSAWSVARSPSKALKSTRVVLVMSGLVEVALEASIVRMALAERIADVAALALSGAQPKKR